MAILNNAAEQEDLLTVARRLAKANAESEETVQAVYLFPDEGEIRLVVIDPVTPPGEKIEPFYFRAAPAQGIPYRSAIAIIRPEEENRLSPPSNWVSWAMARRIWPEE